MSLELRLLYLANLPFKYEHGTKDVQAYMYWIFSVCPPRTIHPASLCSKPGSKDSFAT